MCDAPVSPDRGVACRMDVTMDNPPERYKAYLVRMWQAYRYGQWVFRASLESIHTGEHCNFSSLEALIAFLRNEALERSTDEIDKNDGSNRDMLSP